MNVAIADVKDNLPEAHDELVALAGDAARIISQNCDVTSLDAMQAFHAAVDARFGPVHCLMNNAGIATRGTPPWGGVNMFGIINGCHAFIPAMLAHGQAGAVINAGSKQGITRPPGNYSGVLRSCLARFCDIGGLPIAGAFIGASLCLYADDIKFSAGKTALCCDRGGDGGLFHGGIGARRVLYYLPGWRNRPAFGRKTHPWNTDDIIKNRPAMSRFLIIKTHLRPI